MSESSDNTNHFTFNMYVIIIQGVQLETWTRYRPWPDMEIWN